MDNPGYNNDENRWVEERIARLSPPQGWKPDTDQAFERVMQRAKPAAMRPVVRLSMAGATLAVIGVVVVLLPWKALWTPETKSADSSAQVAAKPVQATPASPQAITVQVPVPTPPAAASPTQNEAPATPPAQLTPSPQANPPSSPQDAKQETIQPPKKERDPFVDLYLRSKAEYQGTLAGRTADHPDVLIAKARMERARAQVPAEVLEALENPRPPQKKKEPRIIAGNIEEPQKQPVPSIAQAQTPQNPPSSVTPPVVVYQVQPEYTDEARQARVTGIVELLATVRVDGSAKVEQVTKSLGYGLDESAAAAVEKWKFLPGKKDDKPVDVSTTIRVQFGLK